MKRAIAIYIITFIAGVLSALAASGFFVQKIWDNTEDILFGRSVLIQVSQEYMTTMAIETVNALDNNDPDRVYEMACMHLLGHIDHINPEIYRESPGREKEVKELKFSSVELLNTLQGRGYCVQ